jgi:hypothetical protein
MRIERDVVFRGRKVGRLAFQTLPGEHLRIDDTPFLACAINAATLEFHAVLEQLVRATEQGSGKGRGLTANS